MSEENEINEINAIKAEAYDQIKKHQEQLEAMSEQLNQAQGIISQIAQTLLPNEISISIDDLMDTVQKLAPESEGETVQ